MKEKVTPYLQNLAGANAIKHQYFSGQDEAGESTVKYSDPLQEDAHEVVKGLVHKYGNRALLKVSYQCAAHCRFCTRIRQIGRTEGTLVPSDIPPILAYLKAHPEIDDLILSGGDPLYTPKITLQLLDALAAVDTIKVLRIGTRLPLQNPASFETPLLKLLLEKIEQIALVMPFYLLLHVEHPHELTAEARAVVARLRKLPVTLLSQTVFLKGINDEYETLHTLFTNLYHLGVMPYYLYRCDAVQGLEHFVTDAKKEKDIATRLRSKLSGIACPTYVHDVEDGYGKVPVPLGFYNDKGLLIADYKSYNPIFL